MQNIKHNWQLEHTSRCAVVKFLLPFQPQFVEDDPRQQDGKTATHMANNIDDFGPFLMETHFWG